MDYAAAKKDGAYHSAKEQARRHEFAGIWDNELHSVFRDVAPYYELASDVASLGLYSRWRRQFLAWIDVKPGARVLDVCAGTNAIGLGLLRREPTASVSAMDKSAAMQQVGQRAARVRGFEIESVIGDVHTLPFPDESFDIVTLAWASRHLPIVDVVAEVKRVLKPAGAFYHCDMLRPRDPAVEALYCAYLKACVTATALLFRSGPAAWRCRNYFVRAIRQFYSAEEFSELLSHTGFSGVTSRRAPGGIVAFHKAVKPGLVRADQGVRSQAD